MSKLFSFKFLNIRVMVLITRKSTELIDDGTMVSWWDRTGNYYSEPDTY